MKSWNPDVKAYFEDRVFYSKVKNESNENSEGFRSLSRLTSSWFLLPMGDAVVSD